MLQIRALRGFMGPLGRDPRGPQFMENMS